MLAATALPVGAEAQAASACATPGRVTLSDIPAKRAELLPSLKKTIAGYGRQAKKSTCKIDIICVATDGTEATKEVARAQCVVVRDTLVRAGFLKADISTSRKKPGGGFGAGKAYLSLY